MGYYDNKPSAFGDTPDKQVYNKPKERPERNVWFVLFLGAILISRLLTFGFLLPYVPSSPLALFMVVMSLGFIISIIAIWKWKCWGIIGLVLLYIVWAIFNLFNGNLTITLSTFVWLGVFSFLIKDLYREFD